MITPLSLSALLVVVAVTGAAAAPTGTKARYQVGDHPLTVELRPDQARFMAGEPVFADVVYAADDIEIEDGWMGRNQLGRPENYRIAFIDAAGTALPVPDAGMQMGGQAWTVTLETGKDHHARLLLPLWVKALTPGRYQVRVETSIRARAGAAAWQQLDVALEARVEVIADDEAALAALIEALGTRAAMVSGEAKRYLAERKRP